MKAGWRTVTLGDVSIVGAGNSAPQDKRLFEGGTFPFVRTSDVGKIRVGELYAAQDHLNEAGIQKLKLHRAGTILIPKSGASTFLDHRVIMGVDAYVSSHLATLWPKEGIIDGRYLFWISQQIVASEVASDTSYPTLSLEQIKAIEIPLPPLEEQRRIVAVLDEAFAAIAAAAANAEKNLANARELFIAERERILRSPVAGWSQRTLSEICTIKHGFAFKSEHFCDQAEHTLLTPGNFFEAGGYRDRRSKQKYYDGPIPDGFVLSGGDLLVAMTEQAEGLLGSPILVPASGVYLHNQRLGLVQPRPGVDWVNDFFFHVFNTSHLRDQLHRTGTGQKVRHTSPGKIGDVVVHFPATAAEQLAVASQLYDLWSQTEQLSDAYSERLEKLTHLKQSFLHRAFSGELTLKKAATLFARNDNFATPEFAAKVVAFAYERHVAKNRVRNFGTVKAEKILHMVEAIGGVDLGRQPSRKAAGPDDATHRHATWDWARSQHFFRFNKRSSGGHDFEKLSSYSVMIEGARAAIAGTPVEEAIELLVDMDREFAELIATTYAAWNNLIIDQCTATDGDIVLAARDKWHRDKLRFDRSRFHDAIRFIRSNGIVPNGTAKRVGGQEALLL